MKLEVLLQIAAKRCQNVGTDMVLILFWLAPYIGTYCKYLSRVPGVDGYGFCLATHSLLYFLDLVKACTGSSRKNVPVFQCFTLGTLMNLICHVWWALQYLALWATNRN